MPSRASSSSATSTTALPSLDSLSFAFSCACWCSGSRPVSISATASHALPPFVCPVPAPVAPGVSGPGATTSAATTASPQTPTRPEAFAQSHPPAQTSPTAATLLEYSSPSVAATYSPRSAAASSTVAPPLSATSPSFRSVASRRPTRRLWNPANFTPRSPPARASSIRKRRPSTPPPPPVPVPADPLHLLLPSASVPLDSPLLSPAPVHVSARSSLARDSPSPHRSSLPRSLSLRLSDTDKRSSLRALAPPVSSPRAPSPRYPPVATPEPSTPIPFAAKGKNPAYPMATDSQHLHDSALSSGSPAAATADVLRTDASSAFARDLERGPDATPALDLRLSFEGIGSPLSSDSSIMGEDIDGADGEEWGPQHPCYPHLNPYVPVDSHEYTTTRIIRVRRDFLIAGDVAPTFANLYPEILDPAGLPEHEFRRIIERINTDLLHTYNPYSLHNVLDAVLGLVTGWIWEDVGLTNVKLRLRKIERWIEEWNRNMERTMEVEGKGTAPKILPLRLSGYMSLDIQIPDPEIAPAQLSPTTPGSGVPRDGLSTPKSVVAI
ncbi:hypothetical protein TD95_003428 [Thielaviopsis punctulata]|uniref:Ras modification protein ERF4 n=1 Tax=Thielaviopsis punctulata TaxID=72032 RepID=A0A0F4ZFP0_9PEZI|nr:hypothetical protein TD95_003428 [Thielaviopsis punctulata]